MHYIQLIYPYAVCVIVIKSLSGIQVILCNELDAFIVELLDDGLSHIQVFSRLEGV